MIDTTTLLTAGYRRHDPPEDSLAADLYQKPVRNSNGVRLFTLDAYRYDFHGLAAEPDGWQFNIRYYIPEGFFDLELVIEPEMTLEWIELWLEQAYWRLGCIPDPTQ